MNKSKTLVTGGWGYIGTNLVRELLSRGSEVIVIDINPPVKHLKYLLTKVNWINDSINNIKKYDIEVDYVFHLSGIANVKLSVLNPELDFDVNLQSTVKLLEWSRTRKIKKIVFSSSVSVLGNNIINPVSENTAYSPKSPYGASKSSSENYMTTYNNVYGVPTVVARLFNVYGPGQIKLFFSDIIYKLFDNQYEIEIWGGGVQIRDYLHINDLVNGLIILAQRGMEGEIYNLASGIPLRLKDFVKFISKQFSRKTPKIVSTSSFDGDINEWYANIDKISKIGFKQSVNLEEGVKSSVKWYLKNKETFLKIRHERN